MGHPMSRDASEIMDEIAAGHADFRGVSFAKIDELGSIQWPCNDKAPEGTPLMHVGGFVRGKGRFMITEFVPTQERTNRVVPADPHHRPHPVAIQRRRADTADRERRLAPGRRARDPSARCRGARHPRGQHGVECPAAWARPCSVPTISERVQPGVVYTTFHHPESGANVITTDYSDWATNCPEYKVTAVQVTVSNQTVRLAEGMGRARGREQAYRGEASCRGGITSFP